MSLFSFISGGYRTKSRQVCSDAVVNMYPELIMQPHFGASQPTRMNFYNCPGISLLATLPTTPVRALWAGNNRLFAVGGNVLYEVMSNGSVTAYPGTMGSSTNPARVIFIPTGSPVDSPSSGVLAIYDGTDGSVDNVWLADGINPLNPVIAAVDITYMDGYLIALRPPIPPGVADGTVPINTYDGTQFNLSAPLLFPQPGAPLFDPLDYAIKNASADQLQRIYAHHNQLWLFGKRTIDVWIDTGGTAANPFPFQRYPGGFIQQGLWAKESLADLDESLFFFGGDDRGVGVVWRINGYAPQRVSNHAVENAFRQYSVMGFDTSDAVAYSYQEDGHAFYVLGFPSADHTWAYDITTNEWHERGRWDGGSYDPATSLHQHVGRYHAWAAPAGGTLAGNHFLGDYRNGNIYRASIDLYDDDGSPVLYQRTAPHIANEKKIMRHNRLQVDFEMGTVSGAAPQAILNISSNGGATFGPNLPYTLGGTGDFTARAFWWRLGRPRDRVYRVSRTDNNPQSWVDAYLEIVPGNGS